MKVRSFLLLVFLFIGFSNNMFSQKKSIAIKTKKNKDKSVDFYYEKNVPGSYYLTIKFTSLENSGMNTFREVIKYRSGHLFTLTPNDADKNIRFSYKTSWIRGVPNPKTDSLFTYTLPFKKGKHVVIHESNNVGEKYFGDQKPINWKSYIIYRKQADTVTSMRKGVVVKIRNKFTADTSVTKRYTSKTNSVLIEHEDGTFANYKGFKKDAFLVKLGQEVFPQTNLGVLDVFNNSYRLYFSVSYLVIDKINSKEKNTVTNRKRQHAYITPYYYTDSGSSQLVDKTKYKIMFDEEIFLKEFSKKELKKYKKNPAQFE